ncbi:MAG: FAD-dependent oxidoreductase [Saprospiraceae bacterium]|nr:FAD-dependent oxidoreductase [Saprospiraceae bacterium]
MQDYLIIGQGLAGSLLFHELSKRGKNVKILDQGLEGSASVTAAGLINPVTGRRYVKTWMIDELHPKAMEVYAALEALLNIPIYHPGNIVRSLINRREREDWLIRTGDPEYREFLLEDFDLGQYANHTVPLFSYGETQKAAQVDLPLLVKTFRDYLLKTDALIAERFEPEALEFAQDHIRYRNLKARQIVFCEGFRGASNPWFSYLPFNNTKGEILLIRIPGVRFQKIFKHRIFLVPLQDDIYWVGSKYDWNFTDDQPHAESKKYLLERLNDILTVPFEVVDHKAAIRPTVKDRRPFLGVHPKFPQLAIFNGLGTKGASLGPYFANEMADFLVSGKPISAEVSISRITTEQLPPLQG